MISPADETRPSKTQRKRKMDELQTVGEELIALPAERLQTIAIPEDLRAAVRMAQRMTRHDEARRRQLQFIGRLMRELDDPQAVRDALAAARGEAAGETARLHRIERQRSALLADERTLQQMAENCPAVDVQRLRSLRRAALAEQQQGKPPRNYRAIFQLLKALDVAREPAGQKDKHGIQKS